jgi:hypothetical protein
VQPPTLVHYATVDTSFEFESNLGQRLTLVVPADQASDEDARQVNIQISDEGLVAHTSVFMSKSEDLPLPLFLRELAENWHGWQGTRAWESFDEQLRVDAHHDGIGWVTLGITLQPNLVPSPWSVRCELAIEPGEQLQRLADGVDALLSA